MPTTERSEGCYVLPNLADLDSATAANRLGRLLQDAVDGDVA